MNVKSLAIGNLQVNNNIFLAPMAGYTDFPFRSVALKEGYGLCFTELVSAKGLFFGGKSNSELVFCGNDKDKTAVQIFGEDAYYMRKACESDYLKDFSIVDINMGCPVPKVFKNGEGSALLLDIKKAEQIIKECVKSGKTITIKIRIGQVKGDDIARDFCVMAENAGAKLVTIHARVRTDYYSGQPNYNSIYNAKRDTTIPIIANGGIFSVEDAEKMINETGADGIMLARGGIANPFLVSELLNIKPTCSLKEFIFNHISELEKYYPIKRGILEFRKFVGWYFYGKDNAKEIKNAIYSTTSFEELYKIIKSLN